MLLRKQMAVWAKNRTPIAVTAAKWGQTMSRSHPRQRIEEEWGMTGFDHADATAVHQPMMMALSV